MFTAARITRVCLSLCVSIGCCLCFCTQKSPYELRISDWSSDVCSSDLLACTTYVNAPGRRRRRTARGYRVPARTEPRTGDISSRHRSPRPAGATVKGGAPRAACAGNILRVAGVARRSEEHTSELQSLMRISYAVFCLKKKKKNN